MALQFPYFSCANYHVYKLLKVTISSSLRDLVQVTKVEGTLGQMFEAKRTKTDIQADKGKEAGLFIPGFERRG